LAFNGNLHCRAIAELCLQIKAEHIDSCVALLDRFSRLTQAPEEGHYVEISKSKEASRYI
jgi:hypothetical protein